MLHFKRSVSAAALLLATSVCVLASAGAGAAEPYPSRPIHLVVGFPPGGGGDALARMLADAMGKKLKQAIVVENRPGAGGTIAPAFVASASPDGYTLLIAPNSVLGLDKSMFPDTVKYGAADFTQINRLASTFFVLAANNKTDYSTARAFIDAARKTPQAPVFMASPGGPYLDMIAANFNKAGIRMTAVNYKGGGPSALAVMAGDTPVTFNGPGALLPLGSEGKLKILAITASTRSRLMPQVPTLAESGLEGFDVSFWYALLAPAGLPADLVQLLFEASNEAINDPGNRQRLGTLGYEASAFNSWPEFRAYAERDMNAARKP